MKAKIITKKRNTRFEPFTIKLKVETAGDAVDLWHRFNIGKEALLEASVDKDDPQDEYIEKVEFSDYDDAAWKVWDFLDEVLRINNGRNR